MPAIPAINAITLGAIFAQDYASRTAHTAENLIMRRDENNHVAEVIGVVIGIVVIAGGLMYWGIKKEGSCEWGPKKGR